MFSPHLLLAVRRGARTGTRLAAACAAPALLCALAVASPAAAAEQRLTTTTGSAAGYSAAVDGDTLVLGDPLHRGGVGAVYVFQRSGDAWANTAVLTPRSDRPVLSRLAVSPGTIHRASARSAKAARPARITFGLSVAASVELRFERARPGRAVGGRCAKPSRSNRGKPRCTRYVAAGRLTVQGKPGANAVRFTGRLPGHGPLPAGRYRLTGTPTDLSGNKGTARTTTLEIART